nr:hypothetical protein [Tanacetum cinerariifolium]
SSPLNRAPHPIPIFSHKLKKVNWDDVIVISSDDDDDDEEEIPSPTIESRIVQIFLWIIDSGCSKHMTDNRALLTNFVEKFLGSVRFGNNDFAVIAGYGDVGLEVAFRKSTCFVRNEDGVDSLTGDRSSNFYTISLNEVASNSSTCLLAKASFSKSWLWHQRLSYLNFATINKLVKNNLVQGLPKIKFEKDHLCSACEQGKIHRKHHKAGLNIKSKVKDVIHNGSWLCPHDLLVKYPFLSECHAPIIDDNPDFLEWRNSQGITKTFSKKADLVRIWDVSDSLGTKCSLCDGPPDSHDHLFFECLFAHAVCDRMKVLAGIASSLLNIYDIIYDILPIARRITMKSVVAKLVAATAYFLWKERNWRLFNKGKRTHDQICDSIMLSVRLKLLSCRLKKSKNSVRMARLWDLPEVIFM